MTVRERLKALGARIGPFVLVALVALGGGYYAGSRPFPGRVESTTRLRENSRVEENTEVKEAERVSEVETTKKRRVKVVNKKKYREDGSLESETTSTTRDASTKSGVSSSDRTSEAKTSEVSSISRTEDTWKLEESRKGDWRLTALVGAQLQNPLRHSGNPFSSNLLVGLNAERRIIGPFWAGVFIAGTFPATPGVDLRRSGALYAGASLSFQF